MVDGQGADEQLAGYGGNDISFYSGLIRKAKFMSVLDEAQHYKKQNNNWPKGFIIAALQHNMGDTLGNILPAKFRLASAPKVDWLKGNQPSNIYKEHAGSLQENLLRQLYSEPLPALLRYEDHNSMAWSVESRTPFMDYRLLEFTMGLPERFLYKRGTRKTILRDAMHGIHREPFKIFQRKRPAEQEALKRLAVDAEQEGHLRLRLNALSDHVHAQRDPQVGDRADNRGLVWIIHHVTHETLVNLQLVYRQFAQVAER